MQSEGSGIFELIDAIVGVENAEVPISARKLWELIFELDAAVERLRMKEISNCIARWPKNFDLANWAIQNEWMN